MNYPGNGIDPREYLLQNPDLAQLEKTKLQKIKEMMGDKSGLGTAAGVGVLATLALLTSKIKDQKLLAKAIKNNIPINRSVIKPLSAGLIGASSGWAGKHFYDKYNKENY